MPIGASIIAREVAKHTIEENVKNETTKNALKDKLRQAVKAETNDVIKYKVAEEIDDNIMDVGAIRKAFETSKGDELNGKLVQAVKGEAQERAVDDIGEKPSFRADQKSEGSLHDKLKEAVKPDSDESIAPEKNFEVNEVSQVVQNKRDGCERENKVEQELKEKYPESEGYQIVKEAYLRDEDGKFVVDPVTGERRRIDFAVVKDGKVVDSVEVTSMTAPKEEQTAKEQRIRENGGNYVLDNDGRLDVFPDDVSTRIERRE